MKSSSFNLQESEVLVAAIEKILRQVTKLLVGRLAFPKYLSLVRKIFVEEAESYLRREVKRKNVSLTDLGLITGIDTRTLTKIRESEDYKKPVSKSESFFTDLTPEAAVVDKWRSDPEFTDPRSDSPLSLQIWGEGKTFESLVQGTIKSRGITVQSILNRLLDSNSISLTDDDEVVTLHPSIWMPYQNTDAEGVMKSGLLGVSKHLDTVINNILSVTEATEPRFERIFWSNRIDPSKLDQFRETLNEFLEEAIVQAVKRMDPFDKDFKLDKALSAGVGFYYFDSEIS